MTDTDTPLHPIEKSLLTALKSGQKLSIDTLTSITDLSIDQVRRGVEWLKFKGLIIIHASESAIVSLGPNGRLAIERKLPERRLIEAVNAGYLDLNSVARSGTLQQQELSAAVSKARYDNKWIELIDADSGKKMITVNQSASQSSSEEKLLAKLNQQKQIPLSRLSAGEKYALEKLKKRPNLVTEKKYRIVEVSISHDGIKALSALSKQHEMGKPDTNQVTAGNNLTDTSLRPLDVRSEVNILYPGRVHPITDLVNEIKEAFLSLGFTEIEGNVIQSSFWNFDALFIPQDHPARDMQDTFYLKEKKQVGTAYIKQIEKISRTHKKWWKYDWSIEEARKLTLRTHTTCVTVKYLADYRPDEARVFSVGRVFRNEKSSYKHLVEFNQVEGVVVGKNLSLRDLMGLQVEFYKKLGIKKVKFWPTYFPYTEPSLQSMIFSENLNKWVELFGMGVFRPQVTKPLCIENPVLAWGGGIERIAMLRLGLEDVREIYANNLRWLRSVPKCQL